jgi:adenylate cyclase
LSSDESEHCFMVALIFDSPDLTHVSNESSERGSHRLAFMGAGNTSAGELVDPASRLTIKGTLDATFIAAETTHAAVLFADMRGYMGLAERLPPAQVASLLQEFFTILARITIEFGGQVFHMAGDGMMAGFAVRDPGRSGARAALTAGRAMLQSFAPVAIAWRNEFEVVTGIGIGLHLGEVALGSLGPPGKEAITMIGDTANVAARLCSRARAGEVLFSCAVAAALAADGDGPGDGPKPFLQLPQFELRGRNELLDVWCVPAPERWAH